MAANITEEASRLRASAASSIIQNELDLKEIERLANFTIDSDTSDKLSDNEFKRLIAIGEKTAKLLQQVTTNTPILCSAIAASIFSSNSAKDITPIIDQLDKANGYLKETESKLSEFKDKSGYTEKREVLEAVQNGINNTLKQLKSAINQLHLLLFG